MNQQDLLKDMAETNQVGLNQIVERIIQRVVSKLNADEKKVMDWYFGSIDSPQIVDLERSFLEAVDADWSK